ncbi:hypothetical protein [Actibacterium pelagium]|uniref:Uncharacterized protein n=1 Tax=Actibacterium pelagium TaxID=2029103 RepID=A0A917AHY4_9RHOB|nr:hypothetical protein [Actibacterium pelagium]GGE54449.1 hypothetical protein GCM10011517_22580 [Actibacterium pelagium]
MEQTEFENFVDRFYEKPDLDRAIEGLRFYLSQTGGFVCGEDVLMPYLFGRLTQLHPEITPRIRKVLEEEARSKPDFAASLSMWLDGPVPENALETIIQSPQDNDLLWIEFSLTGQPEPIIRLIDLFERADKIRVKLAERLAAPEPFLGRLFQRRKRTCEKFRCILDVHIDSEAGTICSRDDLDALCFMRGDAMIDKKQMDQMGKFFPIGLSAEEVNYCLTKATAKWSLCLSAIKNERVRSIINEQINERSGPALLTLLEIAARASLATDDHPTAAGYLDRFIEMNPFRAELQGLRAPFAADAEIASLSKITGEAVICQPTLTKVDVTEIVERCLANERGVQSGYGQMNAGIRKGEIFEDAEEQKYIEWTYKFDVSGSFDVLQWMDPDDWDQWRSIDGKTYQSAGLWFETKDKKTKRLLAGVNSMLRDAGWIKALETGAPISFDEYEWCDSGFLKIRARSRVLHRVIEKVLPIKSANRRGFAEIEVWVDLQSNRLVVCDAFIKNVVLNDRVAHLVLHQIFAMPNAIVSIDHPEVMVAAPGSDIEPGTDVTMYQVPSQSKLFDPSD